ncbi:hypothetical protein MRX96_015363 [Rhipicephalus microplus]
MEAYRVYTKKAGKRARSHVMYARYPVPSQAPPSHTRNPATVGRATFCEGEGGGGHLVLFCYADTELVTVGTRRFATSAGRGEWEPRQRSRLCVPTTACYETMCEDCCCFLLVTAVVSAAVLFVPFAAVVS